MNAIHIRKFSMAVGLTWVCCTSVCAVVLVSVGKEATVSFFNSLLHGMDTAPSSAWIFLYEVCIRLVETFILGWLVGRVLPGFIISVCLKIKTMIKKKDILKNKILQSNFQFAAGGCSTE